MTRPTLRGVSHLLVKLYPAEFRRRHADELHATLDEFGEQAIRPAVVLDLARGVARERVSALFDLGPATLISLLVAAPFLVMLTMVAADYEPPFVSAMTGPDGTPGPLGRVVMIGWLVSLPVALAINAWPRFTGSRAAPRFVPPPDSRPWVWARSAGRCS